MNNSIAFIGFAAAALGYAGMTALMLYGRSGQSGYALLFIAAVMIDAGSCALGAYVSFTRGFTGDIWVLSESLRNSLWSVALIWLAWLPDRPQHARKLTVASPVFFGVIAFCALGAAMAHAVLAGVVTKHAFNFLTALCGLVAAEQLYRSVRPIRRWAIKYLCMAAVSGFMFDLVMSGNVLLFGDTSQPWYSARGYAYLIVLPLIAVTVTRNRKNWLMDIGISRTLVFRSALLGLALVIIAVGGVAVWAIHTVGMYWGDAVSAVVAFGTVVLVATLMASSRARAGVRLFLAKNFFRFRYDYRDQWLRISQIGGQTGFQNSEDSGAEADTSEDSLETRAIVGLTQLVDSPGGALWMRDRDNNFTCAGAWRYGGNTPTVKLSTSMIRWLEEHQECLHLPSLAEKSAGTLGFSLPPGMPFSPRDWLLIPLNVDRRLHGFVVATRSTVRVAINWEVREVLQAASRQIATYLVQRQATEMLMHARQFESFNRMSAFIAHDMKNLTSQLSFLLSNTRKHMANPAFQEDMIGTLHSVVNSMKDMLAQLKPGEITEDRSVSVSLSEMVTTVASSKRRGGTVPEVVVDPLAVNLHVLAQPDRLKRVIGNLLQNALEASGETATVKIRASGSPCRAQIDIVDSGPGMTEVFIRTRLFKPFESTKKDGMGLGSFEAREYVQELGGTLEVISVLGAGTTMRIFLPTERVTEALGEVGT